MNIEDFTTQDKADFLTAIGLTAPINVIDAAERKALPDTVVGQTRVIQGDMAGILWNLIAADVTQDASWIGVPYTVDPDGSMIVRMELSELTEIIPDENVLGVVRGQLRLGDGVTEGGIDPFPHILPTIAMGGASAGYISVATAIPSNWLQTDPNKTLLTSLQIGNRVTSVGDSAFFQCSGFKGSLIIPDSVLTIGAGAFRELTGLTGDLVIGNGVTSTGDSAFYGCNNLTGSLVMGNSLVTIGHNTFSLCTKLTGTLVISDSVEAVGANAFFNCVSLTGLVLGASVQTIGSLAFGNMGNVEGSVNIPVTVTSVGVAAFQFCTKMTNVDCYTTRTVMTASANVFIGCTMLNTIHVRELDDTWTAGSHTIGGRVVTVIKDL